MPGLGPNVDPLCASITPTIALNNEDPILIAIRQLPLAEAPQEEEQKSLLQWRLDGELQGTKGDVMISGWTSVSVCLDAGSPRTVPFLEKTTSSVFIIPKSINVGTESTKRSSAS
ncbi:hypothetical protein HAX54_050679 [Datura stramonium]|uniref:Uncharacterized protein n=1 Tax=Datura stramonium TaxID=4076 RepID=A0ABS8RR49_DATST|nr:hypothetical protein [Datura stramonium]